MNDWRATLRICRRELRKGGCCMGLNAAKHGWCSVNRHKDKWRECGMEMPDMNPDRPGGEPTREDLLEVFRRKFRDCKFPRQATDAEIQAILTPRVHREEGSCGPGTISDHLKMTAREWKLWAHWNDACPEVGHKPVLSGKRAFVTAAREAFGVAMPGAIETMPVEVLPPEEADTLHATFNGLGVDDPWTDQENEWTAQFGERFRRGVAFFVECGEVLTAARHVMVHGRFTRWIDEVLPISTRTARTFMQIARDGNIRRYVESSKTAAAAVLPPDRTILTELCGMEAEAFDGLVDSGVIHAEMRRGDLKRHTIKARHGGGQAEPPPGGQYGVILADPPWPFATRGDGGKGRSAENHYPTMTLGEIMNVPGVELAAADAVLFLWVTSDLIAHAPAVAHGWGFQIVSTAFVWVKEGAPGLGYWTRKGAEICLLGTRGSPKRLAADVAEVIHAPRRGHSRKPGEVYERVERLAAGPYLELFARPLERRPGWTYWGNDPALQEAAE